MSGIARISAERARQIGGEGWSAAHDDEHAEGEMAWAAVCYAAPGKVYRVASGPYDPWPWERHWDKRTKHDRIRQLTIAGALIAAEIDRLLRVESTRTPAQSAQPEAGGMT